MDKILVAVSEANTARFLRSSLEAAGFQVLTAVEGDAAWQVARAAQPALAVVAADASGLGRDLLVRLHADANLAFLPVLIIGEPVPPQSIAEWLMWGADDYIGQPVSARLLSALVHAKLRRGGSDPAAHPTQLLL